MPRITLRLQDGAIEGEVTIEDTTVSHDEVKTLLFEIMNRSRLTAKDGIVQLALKDCSKPLKVTHLGKCLHEYTDKSNDSYDEEFDRGIRGLVPSWFTHCGGALTADY